MTKNEIKRKSTFVSLEGDEFSMVHGTMGRVIREDILNSKRVKSGGFDTSSMVIQANDAETDPLEPELYRHPLQQLEDPAKHHRIPVMEREPKDSLTGMTGDHTGDIDQSEAQLFDPQRPPGAIQMSIFEDLYQVIGKKLELEERRIGQEVLGKDMI